MGPGRPTGWSGIKATGSSSQEPFRSRQATTYPDPTYAGRHHHPEQEAEAIHVAEIIGQRAKNEALRIARLLTAKPDAELVGRAEHDVRDRIHALGAHAIEIAHRQRKKGDTAGRA